MHTFQTDADTGRAYEAKGFKVVFSHYVLAGGQDKSSPDYSATVECFLDAPMLIEPVVVLREVDGFRICKCSHAPKVWVLEPGDKNYGGGWFENEQAAVDSIVARVKQIKANRRRIAGEKTVARRVVRDLLAAGYSLSVDDGEETSVKKSTKFKEIVDAMMTTDEDHLYAHKQGCKTSFVRFVYGNDSWEVICDYGVSLEEHLKGAHAVCERLEARGR
jgi:hypothetical protein